MTNKSQTEEKEDVEFSQMTAKDLIDMARGVCNGVRIRISSCILSLDYFKNTEQYARDKLGSVMSDRIAEISDEDHKILTCGLLRVFNFCDPKDIPKLAEEYDMRDFAISYPDDAIKSCEKAINTACIALAHCAIEDLFFIYIGIGSGINSEKALEWSGNKQVKISTIVDKSSENIITENIWDWAASTKNNSLLKNWNILNALLPPKDSCKDIYDTNRLTQFDKIRHDAIHGHGELLGTVKMNEELVWLQFLCTSMLFNIIDWIKETMGEEKVSE